MMSMGTAPRFKSANTPRCFRCSSHTAVFRGTKNTVKLGTCGIGAVDLVSLACAFCASAKGPPEIAQTVFSMSITML